MGEGTPKRGGSSKIGDGFLPLTDRHMTHMRIFFLPINFSTNSAPQLILKILLVVNHSVNLISYYTMLQKNANP